ncbi:hypothetical protein BY458DRAFT_444144 [Sporodiniella umbellata]|nr:hypothetical protein BY458DRAFT_444144 [Sporodiniella umbellata]
MSESIIPKIKSVKQRLLNIALALDIELSTLSHAYVYLEKLIQKNIINRKNRKLIAAVKINEHKSICFRNLSEQLDIGAKELKEYEFSIFVDLDYSLYVPIEDFMPHLNQLLSKTNYRSLQDYVGKKPFYEIKELL